MNPHHQVPSAFGKSLVAADRREKVERIAATDRQCEPDILDHAEILKQIIALKRARHAHAADPIRWRPGDIAVLQQNAARARLQLTADLIDEAGLAGAIWTDDHVPLTRRDGEVDVVGDDQTAERFVETFEAQDSHGRTRRHCNLCKVPHRPPGKNITQQMNVTPMMASQCSLYELTTFFIKRTIAAPMAGPINVPAPPSMVMIKMSPDAVQYTASAEMKPLKMA